MQERVIHQNVDVVIVARHLEVILSSHEGEAGAHFDEELFHVFDKAEFHVALVVLVGEGQHIKDIRVFQHRLDLVGLRRGQGLGEVVGQGPVFAVVVEFDGLLQITCCPMGRDALNHIPIAGADVLDLLHEDEVVRPRQMLNGEREVVAVKLRNH